MIRLITINDIISGKIPNGFEDYDIIVIRNLPKNVKTSLIFDDFEGPIEKTIHGEKYAVCRRTNQDG